MVIFDPSMKGSIRLEKKEGIAKICFGHPQGNCLPPELLDQLATSLVQAENDITVRVVIISSDGYGAFCGGASLHVLKELETLEQGTAFFMGFARLINTIRKMTKFVIARIHGKVVGGGVGLVAACDYAFALEKSAIKLSELSIGIGPYVIEPAVSRKIGVTAFTQLSLDSKNWKTASWASDKGLYTHLSKDTEALDVALNEKVSLFASYAPEACKTLRKLHWKDTDHWEELLPKNAEITAKLALSDFTQNFIKSL